MSARRASRLESIRRSTARTLSAGMPASRQAGVRVVVPKASGRWASRARSRLDPTKPLAPRTRIGPCRCRIFSARPAGVDVLRDLIASAADISVLPPLAVEELEDRGRIEPAFAAVEPLRAV